MSIKDIFFKELDRPINGVVKADQSDDATVHQELDEYVVTNELEKHFRSFFESYGTDLNDPSIANRVGVWISGFFGSGKSHFLKTLSYLLANIEARDDQGNARQAVSFFDASKLRDATIRADIDKAVANSADVILFNIDSKASSNDAGNPILNVFLRVFNEHQGFSGDHPHIAHMERHLAQRGVYERFKQAFNDSTGMDWTEERDGYQFYQDDIEQAVAAALDLSAEAAHKWFEDSEQTFSVSVENFCNWVREYLDTQPAKHRVLFLVDEVGQFIGSDTKLMLTLQTITENLGTICKGRAWIIVTSQADMDAVLGELSASKANDFSKIAGRFKTRLSLSSSNTDEVIQKRLLRKTPEAEAELRALWEQKGDILRNQITFDRSGPTLKNFDGPESFINNYPFAPYHFQLVQKVFEEIRKVGATGAHLAYGERSMLDAFQMAAMAIAEKPLGALIPMYSFYRAVEGFLDTAVKRTIDQAGESSVLDAFDVQILRTLFMIRYVDLIKGTLDNLVTLSIEQVDEDKLALRRRIEETLQRLEKESLITRNGDEFVFLTNEERDITRKIKATEIAGSEENKALSDLIYKDLLKDKNKFRYIVNKTDYSIGRYLDGHSLEGRYEHDLRVEVISPLDLDYALYGEAGCINKSNEAPAGMALLKLPDSKDFFTELRTWLKTNKFIRLNDDGSQPELSKILAERGRENQERKKRLRLLLEELAERAEVYAQGQHLKLKSNNIVSKFDEACQYLLENTFTKLGYLRVLQQEPERELHAILHTSDIGQLGLTLDGDEGNPQAIKEVEQFISLRASGNERLLVADIIERFSKRPYGWPDGEILLVLGRLAASSRISFHAAGPSMPLPDAFEYLTNSRKRREVSVQMKRQTEEGLLKQARNLTQELFNALGPAGEKELFEYYCVQFDSWRSNLEKYKATVSAGRFPGKDAIEQALLSLQRLLSNTDSVDFFKAVVDNKDDFLDLEEDYRDLHEFFTNQVHTWQQLQQALRRFDKNKPALDKDEKARKALAELKAIEQNTTPYGQLHQVATLVDTVEAINAATLAEKRQHALARVDEKITQLQTEIAKSGIETAELSNRLLRPIQLVKADLETETSIANIYMLQTQTADERLHDGVFELERAIQAEAERQQKIQQEHAKAAQAANSANGAKEDRAPALVPTSKPVAPPKPVVEVVATSVFNKLGNGLYLESQNDIDRFIEALKGELDSAIQQDNRIRIR
ncbi:BREX system P-loop protein BrxC [Pseudomonas sp. MF5691]|uniref:BREX system P-loop protein BrxC n=1 Tax=Pseudomonas TaxID=286 RepID=UPI0018E7B297|nr:MULTISPECIES: BREX system P-loop protein BrxC [Pseudomonas]MBJ2291198.1 BREX system P-loop protein BrxC [Pseudomonas sp. MF5691]MBM6446148.1 BREX system P-loop protein BrxC [Pseudomonas sp. MIL9]MCT8950037.1 BREX system P-loop protein BrxC [Pseudomonas iridis]